MKITNRRAFYDYRILEKFEAGINLFGAEVKAVRLGHADLTGSHVKILGSEAYLINAKIFPYKFARPEGYDERRTRKLLLHKREIIALKSKTEGQGLAIVPISLYTTSHLIKVELALAKGKKEFDKKEAIKRKDIQREEEQELSDAI
ncbi:MAG: SsrA-binding protein SmpB [Candidatus Levybacteria bacterium]|nr:SsrA-binding protein SmpB [Candidatus Levybacteria bacterium]